MFDFFKNLSYIAAVCIAFVACPVSGMLIGGAITGGGGGGALLGMAIGSIVSGGIGYYQARSVINAAHQLQTSALTETNRLLEGRLAVLEGIAQQVAHLETVVRVAEDNLRNATRANEVEQSRRESSEQLRRQTEDALKIAERRYLTVFREHRLAGDIVTTLKERVTSNNIDETELNAELDRLGTHLANNL